MANDNKRFLDKIGVQYLWDKINEYFSQIGHRHETSDVNGLDEYMEENAKAIRDTEKVIEVLPTLPLYPSEEQLGIIYACNGRLYRAKKLNTLTLDFSKIEPNEEGYVTREIFMNFINQNGMNIVMDYDGESDFQSYTFEKYNNGLYLDGRLKFTYERRQTSEEFNYWNNIYIKSVKITAQSPYDEDTEEVWQGCVDYYFDDYNDGGINNSWWLGNEFLPTIENKNFIFGDGYEIKFVDYATFNIDENGQPFTLLKLELELVTCNSPEDYEDGIFHDFLVWEEVSEEELPIEDVTPATEDTRKRFYREIENNNIYVTDAEYNPGAGGFVIDIVHPKTGGQINDTDELRGYIDPSEVWIDSVNGIEQIYADNRYWLNDLGERVTITPIRVGTKNNSGSIFLSIKTDVDLYFSPYISFNASTQEAIIEQDYTTIEVDDADAGDTEEYEVEVFDNINLLEKKWTIVHVPASQEVYINTNRRCYLHKIVKKGEGEGDRYYWSQIAKIQDIEDRINALPEVARTGSYTDLFNKPCIGDVQTYDWDKNEDLPIIDEGTENCDNRLKQLLRWNDSLYTAVVNDSGVSIDMRDFSNRYTTTRPEVQGPLTEYIFKTRMDLRSTAAYEDYYVSGSKYMIQNTKNIGLQLGSSSDYGELLVAMRDIDDTKRMLFNSIDVSLQSWSSDGEMTTDNANIYVEIGTSETIDDGESQTHNLTPQQTKNVWLKKYSDEYTEEWVETSFLADSKGISSDYPIYYIKGPSSEDVINFINSLRQGDKLKINNVVMTVNHTDGENILFDYIDNYPQGEKYTIYKLQRAYIQSPLLRETVSLQGRDCDYIKIWTQYDEEPEQYGRRCVIRSIVFNDIKYEFDPNPVYNRIFYRKDYWKQISGNGSIKVIDLTGDE